MSRTILTGASGFLGQHIVRELTKDNTIELITLGRSLTNKIIFDIAYGASFKIESGECDCLIHAAGLAHVTPLTKAIQNDFITTNVTGTNNLLHGLEKQNVIPRHIVYISSVSVYGLTQGEDITENHPLKATDPYGKSKIEAESVITKWAKDKNVKLTILRLPLLVGINPPGNLGSMIRSLKKGIYLSIGKGQAKKSMVMAGDVAKVILIAKEYPGVYNLTDGYHPAFFELEKIISDQLGVNIPANISAATAQFLGWIGDVLNILLIGKSPLTSGKIEKIKSTLTFNDQKARRTFGWNPSRVIDTFKIE